MTALTISTRRGILALALAALLAMSMPSQALAADNFRFNGEAAFATWFLDDAFHTTVSVGAFDGRFHNPPGPAEEAEDVVVFVSQSFCDEDADELVFRHFIGFGDATVDIDHARLSEAMVDGRLSVQGSEARVSDCDEFAFPGLGEFEHFGEFDVAVASAWEATGGLNRSINVFHFDGEGFKVRSQSMTRSRTADATATLTGLEAFDVGTDLGESEFADIVSFKSSDVFIEQPG